MSEGPLVVVIAGPNGAGKSTCAAAWIPPGMPYVNADEIAKTLPGYPSSAVDYRAGRHSLERIGELSKAGTSFAIETTLAGRTYAARLAQLQQTGFFFRLIYLWTPSAEFSAERVSRRVRLGGHDIPKEMIRRRHLAGARNFLALYRPLADEWVAADNYSGRSLRTIARGSRGEGPEILDPLTWQQLERYAKHG